MDRDTPGGCLKKQVQYTVYSYTMIPPFGALRARMLKSWGLRARMSKQMLSLRARMSNVALRARTSLTDGALRARTSNKCWCFAQEYQSLALRAKLSEKSLIEVGTGLRSASRRGWPFLLQ